MSVCVSRGCVCQGLSHPGLSAFSAHRVPLGAPPGGGFLCFFLNLFFNLFLSALGLHCCVRAFSSCGERGLLFVAVHGLLIAVTSLVAEHGL